MKTLSLDLAYRIVPVGGRPSLGKLRVDIAQLLEKETAAAVQAERDSQFPGVAAERERLGWLAADLNIREKKHNTAVKRFEDLKQAVLAYFRWQDGDGCVTECSGRFVKMRQAFKAWDEGSSVLLQEPIRV